MNGPPPTFGGTPVGWPLPVFLPGGHLHFLHIGKCAGTSVRLLVQSCFATDECFQHRIGSHGYLGPAQFEDSWREHPSGAFSCSHVGSSIFDLCAKPLNVFTWLRDPLEAVFSIIYFIAQQVEISAGRTASFIAVAEIVRGAKNPFEAFLKVAELHRNASANEFHPLRPLSYLLSQPARRADLPYPEAVRTSVDTLRKCFFIGLLEEQQTSLEMLSRFLPLRSPARSFRMNPTLVRPDTRLALTEEQAAEVRSMLAGEYGVYDEGKRLWDLQRKALQEEGWLTQPPERRITHAFRRLHPELLERGRWTADSPAFAEGINDMEFTDSDAPGGKLFWRWTSPGDRAAIRLPIQTGQTVRFSLELSKITPPPQLKAIGLAVGGREVPLRYRGRSAHGYYFETILHKYLLSEQGTEVEICTAPFRGSESDPRQLGVAILAIAWEPDGCADLHSRNRKESQKAGKEKPL
jgi:hypothetical protein